MSFWPTFAARADAHPDLAAVVTGDRVVTLRELASSARATAGHIPGPSAPGEGARRVLITSQEPLAILERVLACWSVGATPAVLHESSPAAQLARASDILHPVAALTDDAMAAPGAASVDRAHEAAPTAAAAEDAEALVLSTSGSLGDPKLIAVAHRTIDCHVDVVTRLLALGPGDRILVPTPLSHSHGLVGGVMAGLATGAVVHLTRPGAPASAVQKHMREHAVTIVQGLPSFFRLFFPYWTGEPFPSLRVVSVGGEPCSEKLAADLRAAFPNAERAMVYGLAEAGTRICQISLDDPRAMRGGIGCPLDHFDWRLAPVDDESPGDARRGELLVRGRSVFLGYARADGGYGGLDAEGFLHTRDLMEADDSGCLYHRGRLDSLFKVGGRLVNPVEVEDAARAVPGVAEALCRPLPHELLGKVVALDVVLAPGASATPAEIRQACGACLERYKRPTEVNLVDALPRGPTGKLQRARR